MNQRSPGQESRRSKWRFLEPAALQGMKNLRFAARRVVEGSFSGRHRSKMRGSSVEFADYREYSPGDDLRHLDWKVYLRTRRPYVRTYVEETNLSVNLLLDVSASMAFGGREPAVQDSRRGARLTKLDYCRYLAASLAYLIVSSRDQAGLALVDQDVQEYCAPGATFRHLDVLLNAIERAEPGRGTRLGASLDKIYALCRRRGILIVISDFLDDRMEELFRAIRLFRHRRFEVILFHVVHPEELHLPEGRAFRFYDPESKGEVEVDPQDVQSDYDLAFEDFRRSVRAKALGSGCEYEMVNTRTPYPDLLHHYLLFRQGWQR